MNTLVVMIHADFSVTYLDRASQVWRRRQRAIDWLTLDLLHPEVRAHRIRRLLASGWQATDAGLVLANSA